MSNKEAVEILFVEDNPQDAEMTMRALKKRNLANSLAWVKDGAEALDFIFGAGQPGAEPLTHRIKVILLDLKLPKVDGIEVLTRLKADARTRAIPVVMLTSSREEPDIKRCYELGANSYIVKPVSFDKFSEAIAQLGMYWMVLNEAPGRRPAEPRA